jgi:hypothetical protein
VERASLPKGAVRSTLSATFRVLAPKLHRPESCSRLQPVNARLPFYVLSSNVLYMKESFFL